MKLGNYCSKIGSGATPRGGKGSYKTEGIPLIRSQNIHDWDFKTHGLAYLDNDQAEALSSATVYPGDVLLNITGDSVARACLVPENITPARVNQHVAIIRPTDSLCSTYLLAFLQQHKALLLKLASSGATRNALTKSMIEEIDVSFPPINVQKRICAILDVIQQKITLNTRINDHLEECLLAQYDFLFGEKASSEFTGVLNDIGTIVGGATPSKKRMSEYYCVDGIGWITPRDLSSTRDKFISHGADDITQQGLNSCSAKLLPAGSVLFSSRAPIGYIAIASDALATNQGFKSVVPHEDIGTAFVYCFLARNRQRMADAGSGTTFPEVSGSAMKNIELILPDKILCAKFSTWAQPLLDRQKQLECENRCLAALRDAVLPKLVSGEIDLSKPDNMLSGI